MNLANDLNNAMNGNGGKIPFSFIRGLVEHDDTKIVHVQPTPNTRVCVIVLPTGHNLVGYAQVLDSANDDELIGQEVALTNATNEMWAMLGAIALATYKG